MLNEVNPQQFHDEVARRLKMPVKEFMTKKLFTSTENSSIAEITRLMVEHSVKRIPVVRNNKLIGIITRRDAIRAMAKLTN